MLCNGTFPVSQFLRKTRRYITRGENPTSGAVKICRFCGTAFHYYFPSDFVKIIFRRISPVSAIAYVRVYVSCQLHAPFGKCTSEKLFATRKLCEPHLFTPMHDASHNSIPRIQMHTFCMRKYMHLHRGIFYRTCRMEKN